MKCRVCSGPLKELLNLGNLFPSGFVANEEVENQRQPLVLAQCLSCNLVQLKHMINPDLMYRNYWYESALNPSMLRSLRDVVGSSLFAFGTGKSGVVLDIGCNDGSMLGMYPDEFKKIGFDPALNLHDKAKANCDHAVADYFTAEKYPMEQCGPADIVTAIAMFYDLNEPGKFLDDVISVMSPNGIFVVQMTDFVSMLKANAFDNICHEHACYYTLDQIRKLFSKHGLTVFDVSYNGVNGGSMRVFASRQERPVTERLAKAQIDEIKYLSAYNFSVNDFALRVTNIGIAIVRELLNMKAERKLICALGASTKGNTLLQFLGINPVLIKAIGEVNKNKYGLLTVGSNIPIVGEEDILALKPDVLFILPWHFRDFFIDKISNALEEVEIFFPLPTPEIVSIYHGKITSRMVMYF